MSRTYKRMADIESQAEVLRMRYEKKVQDLIKREVAADETACPVKKGGRCKLRECLRFCNMDLPGDICHRFEKDYKRLAQAAAGNGTPEYLSQALNEGNGTYKP